MILDDSSTVYSLGDVILSVWIAVMLISVTSLHRLMTKPHALRDAAHRQKQISDHQSSFLSSRISLYSMDTPWR
jgi:hypothetical protein